MSVKTVNNNSNQSFQESKTRSSSLFLSTILQKPSRAMFIYQLKSHFASIHSRKEFAGSSTLSSNRSRLSSVTLSRLSNTLKLLTTCRCHLMLLAKQTCTVSTKKSWISLLWEELVWVTLLFHQSTLTKIKSKQPNRFSSG